MNAGSGEEESPPEDPGPREEEAGAGEDEDPGAPTVCDFWPDVQAATVMGDALIYAFHGKSPRLDVLLLPFVKFSKSFMESRIKPDC